MSIGKSEATEKLKKAGFTASLIDGVVMIKVKPDIYEKESNRVKNFLKTIGYNCSFGIQGDMSASTGSGFENDDVDDAEGDIDEETAEAFDPRAITGYAEDEETGQMSLLS